MMNYGYGDGSGWSAWLMMFPIMLIFWGAAVWGIVVAIRHWGTSGSHTHGEPPRRGALEILDERFARGEIDTEEYRSRRDALTSGR